MKHASKTMFVWDDISILRYKNESTERLDEIEVPFCHDIRAHMHTVNIEYRLIIIVHAL